MARESRKRDSMLPNIQKVELDEKNIKWRIIAVIGFFVIGISALIYSVLKIFSEEPGFVEIKANTTDGMTAASDLKFMYNLGVGDLGPTEEKKKLVALYTDAASLAFKTFTNDKIDTSIKNVRYINEHPNEAIKVSALLYKAFEKLEEYDSRYIFLGPVFDYYDSIFYSANDTEVGYFDPILNEDVKTYFDEVLEFANSEEHINIKLLGHNEIKLEVSEDYLEYAKTNGVEDYIDFFYLKNAFIVDYIADVMHENHMNNGVISCYDGITRNLGDTSTDYTYNVYNRDDNYIYKAGEYNYKGAKSIVFIKNYLMNNAEVNHYYTLEDGSVRTCYVDYDGLCKSSTNNIVGLSDKGCADIMLSLIPIFVSDDFDKEGIIALSKNNIDYIYFEKDKIITNIDEKCFKLN